MERRDHHDWASDAYVEEWVERQRAADPDRAQRFQIMCDLFPFANDARVTILDVGAGYGPVSKFILDQFANATCIAQDGSHADAAARPADYGQLRRALSSLPVRSVRQRLVAAAVWPL